MTISAYQVDNVIKSYNRQIRLNNSVDLSKEASKKQYVDTLSLTTDFDRKEMYKKISYSLRDVILKSRA
jgi:hypothetical protein